MLYHVRCQRKGKRKKTFKKSSGKGKEKNERPIDRIHGKRERKNETLRL